MKTKITTAVIILCLCAGTLRAQNRQKPAPRMFSNTLKLAAGNYHIPNTAHFHDPFTQIGACYERKIYRRWWTGIGYTEWNTLWKGLFPDGNTGYLSTNPKVILYEEGASWIPRSSRPVTGEVEYRSKYKMLDLYAFYRWQPGSSSHFINVGAGVSYNWGIDIRVASYRERVYPGCFGGYYTDYEIDYLTEHVAYLGIIPQIAYDFWFLKNRFNVGGGYRARYYPGRVKIQHDISIHTGVNF